MMKVWAEIFVDARIPGIHYNELYLKAVEVRTSFLQIGKTPPDITPDLLVAQYPSLRQEIAQKKAHEQQQNAPDDKRYLVNDGRVLCHNCLGTGFSRLKKGNYWGVERCEHEESYVFTDGDEVLSGAEGIRIIETYLAQQGIEFNATIKKVVYGKFGGSE